MTRFTLGVLLTLCTTVFALQKTTVNNSRSNIKNNIIAKVEPTPDGKLKCTLTNGKPCGAADVKALPLGGGVKKLTIADPDGTLECDGKPCTTAHLADINRAVSSMEKRAQGLMNREKK